MENMDDKDGFSGANSSLFLEILDEQDISVEKNRIQEICEKILADAGIVRGRIGIVLVDNETIHKLNLDFLQHDYPTDVISFQVESDLEHGFLEGEVIASVEMAAQRGPEFQWTIHEEILLYVIHGLLHLVGYDDVEPEKRTQMREKERFYLRCVGVEPNDLGFEEISEQEEDAKVDDSDVGSENPNALDLNNQISDLYDDDTRIN